MSLNDLTFYVFKWLNTVVYLVGLGIAVWAFVRCHKFGYLIVALFFALVLFSWHIWPRISHAIYVHRTPIEIQQKDQANFQKAYGEALAKVGHPPPYRMRIDIAPMVLVFGLWVLARREPEYHRPNTALEPTP